MEFLQSPEFQAAFGSLVLLFVGGVAAYLASSVAALLKAKTTTEQINTLQTIAAIAVQAVEQSGLTGTLTDKKQSAINLVNIFLVQHGITGVTAEQIDAAIESAVLEVIGPSTESDTVEVN